MSEHATNFEKQAIANIAAEMPISVVFLRGSSGHSLTAHTVILCYADMIDALSSLASPPFCLPVPFTQRSLAEFVRSGLFECGRDFLVLLAGNVHAAHSVAELRSWVSQVSTAWAELISDHVAMLNSTGAMPASRMEYLAKRFDIDATNLWLLAEEAGEVARGCGKLGRWGYDHVHQVTGESGMRLLEAEVGDLLGIVDIMVARGHFTVEALEAAKLAKLARLEDWYEAPWTPADTAPAETEGLSTPPVTPTTHSAKELIESGYLAKVVLGDDSEELHEVTPPGTPTAQSPRRIANKAYWKERADTMVSRLFPFEDLPQSESSGLAAGSGSDDSSFSHASGRRNLLAVINQILKIVPLHETEIRRSLNLHHASNLYRAPETHDWHSVAATLQLHYEGRTEPWIEESLAVWRGGPDLILVAENINPTL